MKKTHLKYIIKEQTEETVKQCPAATQDLKLNTLNRNRAIQADHIKYGPLNLTDEGYWDYNENGEFDVSNTISTIEGNGWAGELFDIIGPATINSVSIHNSNNIDTTISIGVYGMFGSTINTEPIYSMKLNEQINSYFFKY